MEYGLGAQAQPAPGALNFNEAQAHIFMVEDRYNVHGSHLEEAGQQRLVSPRPAH